MNAPITTEQPGAQVRTEDDQEQPEQASAMHALFQSWEHDDPNEQHETLTYLQQVLDEDRLGARTLFR